MVAVMFEDLLPSSALIMPDAHSSTKYLAKDGSQPWDDEVNITVLGAVALCIFPGE
jgi:hypothetical protein